MSEVRGAYNVDSERPVEDAVTFEKYVTLSERRLRQLVDAAIDNTQECLAALYAEHGDPPRRPKMARLAAMYRNELAAMTAIREEYLLNARPVSEKPANC